MPVTFAEARQIVYDAEAKTWTVGTYEVERDGFEDSTHWLVVRGAAELADTMDPDLVVLDQPVPLVNKQSGVIEYVLPHLSEVARRLDAMRPVHD